MTNSRRKQLSWQIPFLIFLVVGTVFIIRQKNHAPYRSFEGFVFGTVFHVTYQSEMSLDSVIMDAFEKVDHALSMFNAESTVSLINDNRPVPYDDPMFMDVAQLAFEVAKETDGDFDPTVAPLVNLWGFGYKQGQDPTDVAIDSVLSFVGYKRVQLLPHCKVVKDDSRICMDFSAIAKGYGCDAAAEVLRRHGANNFMIEIGGEIFVSGRSPKGTSWRIGVTKPSDDPEGENGELQHVLNITDQGIATSGNYRNFYYLDGKKVAHTIDPKTGRPVQHSLLSATVMAPTCAQADAYSTSFMVMGMEKAQQVLSRHPEMKAFFIYSAPDGELLTWKSEGLE